MGPEEKARRKFSITGRRAPGYRLSPNYFQNFKRIPALIGHKKCFVLFCSIGEQFLLSSFRESYTRAIVSVTACLVHAPKKCTQSGNFWFDIKSPSAFKILSARKLKTLSKNTSLSLQQVFTLESVTSCVNIREFLKDTTTAASHENVAWKSEFIFLQSLP